MPGSIQLSLEVFQWLTLLGLLALLVLRRNVLSDNRACICAACAALLTWMLIFSPICWEHYLIYLCPLWGWLAWTSRQSRVMRIIVAAAIALTWLPLSRVKLTLPEPVASHMLWGMILIFGMALKVLLQAGSVHLRRPFNDDREQAKAQ